MASYSASAPTAPPAKAVLATTTDYDAPIASAALTPNDGSYHNVDAIRPGADALISAMTSNHGFPPGLARVVVNDVIFNFPERIWVVDNSGSMAKGDGHRIKTVGNNTKILECTRWQELRDTVKVHSALAGELLAPTDFRLLNAPGSGAQQYVVCGTGGNSGEAEIMAAMATSPTRGTPLTRHINEIREIVAGKADSLRAEGKQVVVVLATDGVPSNDQGYMNAQSKKEFQRALQTLQGLPIHLVVRLCTDEDEVGDYWNELDTQVELPLDVLDDFVGEATEIYQFNPWLVYGLPLHRAREFGVKHKLFDLLDERPLLASEMYEFILLLLGLSEDDLPDPAVDTKAFGSALDRFLRVLPRTYNPVAKTTTPWLDKRKVMAKMKGGGGCVIA